MESVLKRTRALRHHWGLVVGLLAHDCGACASCDDTHPAGVPSWGNLRCLLNRNRRARRAEAPVHRVHHANLSVIRERGSGGTPCIVGSPSKHRTRIKRAGVCAAPGATTIGPTQLTARRQPIICPRRSLLLHRGLSRRLPVRMIRVPPICHRPAGSRCLLGSPRFLLRVRAAADSIGIGMASIAPMRDTSVHTWGSSGETPAAARLVIFHGAQEDRCRGACTTRSNGSAAHTRRWRRFKLRAPPARRTSGWSGHSLQASMRALAPSPDHPPL